MRSFICYVAICSIVLVMGVVFAINRLALDDFRDNYQSIIESQIEFYFEGYSHDLMDIITSHAVWTETSKALDEKAYDWMYQNASGHIVDSGDFNVDYMYVMDETGAYKEQHGHINIADIENLNVYQRALDDNRSSKEVIWYEGKPLLLVSSPILNDDKSNPKGCYILGRLIDEQSLTNLKTLLSDRYVNKIEVVDTWPQKKSLSPNSVSLSYVLDQENGVYLYTNYSIKFFSFMNNISMLIIISVVVMTAVIAVFVLSANIKKLSSKLIEVITSVKKISTGDYHVKIAPSNIKLMPELHDLVEAINILSVDIEEHISEIDHHAEIIESQYVDMVELMVDTVEMNDKYTYEHSVSVSKYALLIGRAVGYDNLRELELAAKLHDVGKISISSEILNKPGKLTEDEYEVIKTHSDNGYKLLNKAQAFNNAKWGVLYHHEKYGGGGYPHGLKGDEIPLIAQIISVADIYDALTSERAYRKAIKCEEAMVILKEEKGKALNPWLVDIFYDQLIHLNTCQDVGSKS